MEMMNKKRSSKIMNIMTLRVFFLCKDVAILVVYMYSENALIWRTIILKQSKKWKTILSSWKGKREKEFHVCLVFMCTRIETCINKHFSFKIFLLNPSFEKFLDPRLGWRENYACTLHPHPPKKNSYLMKKCI